MNIVPMFVRYWQMRAQTPDTGSALVPVNSDLGELTETPDAEVVPESASGDALLGQAIPLETRLFLEVF